MSGSNNQPGPFYWANTESAAEYATSEWSVNSDMPKRLAQPTINKRVQREKETFFRGERIKNRRNRYGLCYL